MFNKRRKKDKVKKPFYKRKWFIVLVILLIIGSLTEPEENNVTENTNTEVVSLNEQPPESAPVVVPVETVEEEEDEDTQEETEIASDKSEVAPEVEELVEVQEVIEPQEENTFQEAVVTNVVDGDTIDVSFDGTTQRVRLLLVDTPETVHPNKDVQFFGAEASQYTKDQLFNKTVYLERDVSETDKYNRYLYYIWLAKPSSNNPTDEELYTMNFNSLLLENGYAQVSTYPPDIKYVDQFLTRQEIARNNNYGLWNEENANAFLAQQEAAVIAQKSAAAQQTQSVASAGTGEAPKQYDSEPIAANYIGNANTKKLHYPSCGSVRQMAPHNMRELSNRDEAISGGYMPCKRCNP